MKIICLGNATPKAYKNNPKPPEGIPLSALKMFATMICGLSIDHLPKTGDNVMTKDVTTGEDKVLYVMTEAHENAKLREFIEQPVEIPWLGKKCRTKINLSPDSSTSQTIAEVKQIWSISAVGKPGWIAGKNVDPYLLKIIGRELGMADTEDGVTSMIREYEEDTV